MTIESVDFGRSDAEADDRLLDYFIDTGVIRKIQRGQKYFVIGRKGSGKTAIFKALTRNNLKQDVIQLDFGAYPWELHKSIKETGLPPESTYIASWKFCLLMSVCSHWSMEASGKIKEKANEYIRAIYGTETPGMLEFLFNKFKRIRKLELPNAEVLGASGTLGAIEFDPEKAGAVLANSVGRWCERLMQFINENIDALPFTIAIDRLDDGWDATEESKNIIIGIIKSARELNLKLKRPGKPPVVVVMLRSDIYHLLQFNDKNKISGDTEHLLWTEETLHELVDVRIAASLKVDKSKAWDQVFSSERMRQTAPIFSYIIRRTMLRPRDLIVFCTLCREVAVESGHALVQKDDVYEAERRYSESIYNELDDEMHKQLPQAREYLQVIREIGLTRFSFSTWLTAFKSRESGVSVDKAKSCLRHLFDYSILGITRKGGATGGSKTKFIYHDRLLEPNFSNPAEEYCVHGSLVKHLQLKEPRAMSKAGESVMADGSENLDDQPELD